jgi:hypothetical protein
MEDKPSNADLLPARCAVCGDTLDLKRASLPPVGSIAAATDAEPDDSEPRPSMLDPNWYCSRCVFRTNLRRAVGALIFIILMFLAATFARRW